MNLHHPDEVQHRKSRRLKRSIFWTAGLHDIWVFDQHDKWRCFQLFLHVGIEPFSGRILWLKIWWTNHNPRLICGWYCDTVQSLGCNYLHPVSIVSLVTQSFKLCILLPKVTLAQRTMGSQMVTPCFVIFKIQVWHAPCSTSSETSVRVSHPRRPGR